MGYSAAISVLSGRQPAASLYADGRSSDDVIGIRYEAFNKIKTKNPNVTTIMYLNSMFNFAMYNLAGLVNTAEAAGNKMLLRDANNELVILCNDGNYYCNVRVSVSGSVSVCSREEGSLSRGGYLFVWLLVCLSVVKSTWQHACKTGPTPPPPISNGVVDAGRGGWG